MKVLIDESLDVDLRHELVGHDAFTISFMRWKGLKNGALLARASAEGFEALITSDREIEYQQNLAALPCAVFILLADSNGIDDLKPLVPNLMRALASTRSKKIVHVRP